MVTYFKNIWLGIFTVLVGMKITLKHLFVPNVTVQYPNVHPKDSAGTDKMPLNARNRLFLDPELCNGCNGCVRACPVNCIEIDMVKVTPGDEAAPLKDGSKRGLWVTSYTIDFAKCCYCALCLEPCPTLAIQMTPEFEYSEFKRENLKYEFSDMTPEQGKAKKEMYANFMAEKKKKAEEEAKKTAAESTETKAE
jgi:NADH-quinone oxidoreductase subunit I